MLPQETTYFVALLAAGAIDGTIALAAFRRLKESGGTGLAVLLAGTSLYALGYAFGLPATTIPARLGWGRLEFLGLAAIPPAWIMAAAARVKKGGFPTRRAYASLFLIPAASLLVYCTNGYHHLYYGTVSLAPPGPLALISAAKGPWYWLFGLYALMALVFGNFLYAWNWRTEEGSGKRASPAQAGPGLLLAASLLPWAAFPAYLPGGNPSGPDPGPLALTITGLVFGWSLFRQGGPAPITRDAVFQGVREGVLVLDVQNRIVDFNPAARSIIGSLSPRALGRPAEEVLREYPGLVKQLLASGWRQAELQLPWGKGLKCYQLRLSPLENRRRDPIGKTVILMDVTQHTWQVDELQTQARIDALTGIFNRSHLLELGRREIEQAKRRGRPVSVILLDIDHFKRVNDTYGHGAGDVALKNVVTTCAGCLRTRDLLGRWGGEEFLAILPGASPAGALLVAERVRREIAAALLTLDSSTTISLTASFGVAGVEKATRDTSIEDLLRAADQALYRAKNTGRNRVVLSRDRAQPPSSPST